ncbi:MAG: TonB-dependent receptor, partial [Actinobacteria bacterium]|nr:TonB-dependent receptor [Actinomycetota bacterium]
SVRHSDYNTVGTTTNYRVGAQFQPVSDILLRGVFSTGFRAPSVVELFAGDTTTFPVVEDYCEFWGTRPDITDNIRANCAAAGLPPDHELGFQWQSAYF